MLSLLYLVVRALVGSRLRSPASLAARARGEGTGRLVLRALRSAAAPLEFPVGAVTALVGVPVLLALLARTR